MDFIAVLSFSVLVIIILTLIFGVGAYFLYKIRERQGKSKDVISYEELSEESGRKFLFFDEVEGI
jgi:heme/copper-type cytochrome/quinol oxidase subunit 2